MEFHKKYHISIGSNIGDRLNNIQSSIDLIHSRIASILTISSIYETESIGFKGDDFFNICLSFNSFKSPYHIMNELLEIETVLGRNRSKEKKYVSRIIDIDILLVEDMVINSEELKIPHLEICKREKNVYEREKTISEDQIRKLTDELLQCQGKLQETIILLEKAKNDKCKQCCNNVSKMFDSKCLIINKS